MLFSTEYSTALDVLSRFETVLLILRLIEEFNLHPATPLDSPKECSTELIRALLCF